MWQHGARQTAMWAVATLFVACHGSEPAEETVRFRQAEVASFDGVRIVYTVAGEDRRDQAIIFIHDWLASRTHWHEVMRDLGRDHLTAALDLPGHGSSGTKRSEWSIESYGRDVMAVADELELQRIVLVGHSMGALVALESALLLNGRVEAIVAVEGLEDPDSRVGEADLDRMLARYEQDFATVCDQFVRMMFSPQAAPELVSTTAQSMCRSERKPALELLRRLAEYPIGPAMAAVEVPIFAINGELVPTNVEHARRYDPDFEAVIMPGVHHFPMLVAPQDLVAELRAILARLPARR